MIAEALSIAVVGSTMFAIYDSRLSDTVSSLPENIANAALDSIGSAIAIAAMPPEAEGLALATAAKIAFTDAFGLSVILGASLAFIGTLAIAKFMPATVAHGLGAHGVVLVAVVNPNHHLRMQIPPSMTRW